MKGIAGYYFITDASLSRAGSVHDVETAVAAGVSVIQYRQKTGSTSDLYREAYILRSVCRKTLFIVNDRVDIALAVGADGVHVGREDLPCARCREILGPARIVGVTVHSAAEAAEAEKAGADYLGVSPIFATTTKTDAGKPAGIALLREIRRTVRLPLVAIGGITPANAAEVVRAGADALCAISAVVTSADVRKEIERFQSFFAKSA